MTLTEIMKIKKVGDLNHTAEMMGITSNNLSTILSRPKHARHAEALHALETVIETRIEMIENYNYENTAL